MASRNGGGSRSGSRSGRGDAQDPIELSSDSESESYAGSGSGRDDNTDGEYGNDLADGICEFRSRRYHEQECERYFDCPGHVVERVVEDEDVEIGEVNDQRDPMHSDIDDNDDADEDGEEPELPATPPRAPPRDDVAGRTAGNPIVLASSPAVPRADGSLGPARRDLPRMGDLLGPAQRDAPLVAGPSGLRVQGQSAEPPEFVVPRWQPDAEATYCPICHTQFSIFVRKHHCRKCGRVVCNSCSPHRITIPYQYIVQPPWAPRNPGQRYSGILGSPGELGIPGGGESVRLCNPCVPDPNIAPPQAPAVHWRSQSGLQGANPANARWSSYFGGVPVNDLHARSRSVTMMLPGIPSSSRPQRSERNHQDRILSGTPPVYYPHQAPAVPNANLYRQLPPLPPHHTRPAEPAPAPQYQIAEEDECPVCHRELPHRAQPNFEALREAHIKTCIQAHSAYGGSSSAGGPSNASGAAEGSPLPRIPPRRTGMFPYAATEKDCVDSAECSICLEEFEVGVPMARLECLCRFHRMCIDAWFDRHPGRCPMHQHEDFGY
ncbi:hypothetical protein OQA88_3796 [Cercophora sp. LCS_1]